VKGNEFKWQDHFTQDLQRIHVLFVVKRMKSSEWEESLINYKPVM
jgi:hypothetical protein